MWKSQISFLISSSPHFPSFLYPIIDCCYFAVYLTLNISRAIFDYISISPELYLITSHELYLIISQCLTINPCQLSLSHYQFSMSPNIMYFQFFHCVYRKVTLINSVYQFYYSHYKFFIIQFSKPHNVSFKTIFDVKTYLGLSIFLIILITIPLWVWLFMNNSRPICFVHLSTFQWSIFLSSTSHRLSHLSISHHLTTSIYILSYYLIISF